MQQMRVTSHEDLGPAFDELLDTESTLSLAPHAAVLSVTKSAFIMLSTGEIVGIVVASVCGVVILTVVVFWYFCCRQKPYRLGRLNKLQDNGVVSSSSNGSGTDSRLSAADLRINSTSSGSQATTTTTDSSSFDVPSCQESHADGTDGSSVGNRDDKQKLCVRDSRSYGIHKRSSSSGFPFSATAVKSAADNPSFVQDDARLPLPSVAAAENVEASALSTGHGNTIDGSIYRRKPDTSGRDHTKRSSLIRRSYHLDRYVASAIAAKRNRDSAIFPEFQFPPLSSDDDVEIVFAERTVL